jgi:predicted nucleic acid-binding protein
MAFIALLDACVLIKAALRDTILRAAESEQFDLRIAFSWDILDEVRRNLVTNLNIPAQDAEDLVNTIADFFEDGLVEGYEDLIPAMQNHPKDRHVLAAAIRAGAGVIVTSNVGDFPESACTPYDIQVQTPDQFLVQLWGISPQIMAQILVEQAAFLKNPPVTRDRLLDDLARGAPTFVRLVRESRLLSSDL